MKRAFLWVISNVETLVALAIAVLLGILSLVVSVTSADVVNTTLAVLAVLAAALLHDRHRQNVTRDQIAALHQSVDEKLQRALDAAKPIRTLNGADITRAITEAQRNTDRWLFRGSTGTYVRNQVLPYCIDQARAASREFHVMLEILDPSNEAACQDYIRLYQGFASEPDGREQEWTVRETRVESYATILAVCWHKQRYPSLTADLALSTRVSQMRWEASTYFFIVTQRGPQFPAMLVERNEVFFHVLVTDLHTSFQQAHKVPLERARAVTLSPKPTVAEVRALFKALRVSVPDDFAEKDFEDIITEALQGKNPYLAVK